MSSEAATPHEMKDMDLGAVSAQEATGALIEHAAHLRASDLFLNQNSDNLVILVRRWGLIRPIGRVPADQGRHIVSHIKAEAGMNVADHRRPQDGHWVRDMPNGSRIDMRISTMPTLSGEDMTLRLFERGHLEFDLDTLGLLKKELADIKAMLTRPGGLILVTGPTSCGKTTSLYSFLRSLNDGERKINTIEDPVEYTIQGARQSQINPKLGLDFPDMLRGVIRQSPDIIMIGEIRDAVTAQTAVRAANSGHLVFSTLHSRVAAAAIDSMLALGVHPHFLANSLLGVIAQRLVRTLCPECKVKYDLGPETMMFSEVKRFLAPGEGTAMWSAAGCDACRGEGYDGRTGIFEVLTVTPKLRRVIADNKPVAEIRQLAIDEGMLELRRSALIKVARGITTTDEILRVLPSEDLEGGV